MHLNIIYFFDIRIQYIQYLHLRICSCASILTYSVKRKDVSTNKQAYSLIIKNY
jgi:hypothetical protein